MAMQNPNWWDADPVVGAAPSAQPRPQQTVPQPRRQPVQRPRIQFTSDEDALARTIAGEAGGEGEQGMRAVGEVVFNRARSRGQGIQDVVTAPYQFEPWGNPETTRRLLNMRADDPQYLSALSIAREVMAGRSNVTGGADHFYAPELQASLGRAKPDFDNGHGVRIGNQLFFNLEGDGASPTQAVPSGDQEWWKKDPVAREVQGPINQEALAAMNGGASSGPRYTRDNPFIIETDLTPEGAAAQQQAALEIKKGDWIWEPDGTLYQAGADAYSDPNAARASDQVAPGVFARNPNLEDQSRAFITAAAEQIPGVDEAAIAATAAAEGKSFSEVADRYRMMQGLDNQQNRDLRVAGGITGAVASMAAPIGPANQFVGRGVGWLDKGARLSILGAGSGFVQGAASADGGAEERAKGGLLGGAIGFGAAPIAGAATDLAVRAAPRLMSGFSEAGATIGRGFGRQAPDAPITEEATNAAQDYVRRLIDSSGASLENNPGALLGKPITAAEAIGPRGVANMAALGRRSGRSGLMAETTLSARSLERHNRIAQDFSDITGLTPSGAADLAENVVTAGRAKASPLYAEAYSQPVQPTPALERILARPHSKAALRRAYALMRNGDRNPEEMGLFVMSAADNPTGIAGRARATRDADLTADLDALRAGTRTAGSGRGDSLLAFISKNGGVRDEGGELAQIGADTWNRQGAWRNRVVRGDGLSAEEMAQKARDAGYFDDVSDAAMDSADNYQRLSSGDLIEAMDSELRGTPRFAREAGDTERGAAGDLRRARRAALDERLQREGIDINTASNDEIRRALQEADDFEARNMAFLEGEGPDAPRVELVPGEIPSMETLDYVKRGLDSLLTKYRDKVTGRLVLDDDGRAIVKTIGELRGELTGSNDAYRQALAESGDYLSIQSAFDQSERLFRTTTSMRDFQTAIERMGSGERNGLLMGLADKIYRDAERRAVRPTDLALPVTQQKLAALIGAPAADDFLRRIEAEVAMAASGGRMAPGTNAITSDIQQAIREQDGTNPIIDGLAQGIEGGKSGIMSQAVRGLMAPFAGFVRGAASPAPQATRDEIGRLLMMNPEELRGLLNTLPSVAPRSNVGGYVAAPVGSGAGLLAGSQQ